MAVVILVVAVEIAVGNVPARDSPIGKFVVQFIVVHVALPSGFVGFIQLGVRVAALAVT